MQPTQQVSLGAELLVSTLRLIKRKSERDKALPVEAVRRRLRLIEPFVPRPPLGTSSTPLDFDGISAMEVKVSQARNDRCVLFFHGGGYRIGTAALYRDFMWRISAATHAPVVYFDYRLAPEHPFPAAVEDAGRVYLAIAGRTSPRRLAFAGESAGGGLALATLLKLRDEGHGLPAAAAVLSPWTDLALAGASLRSNADADPMMNPERVPAVASSYLRGADPRHPYASPLYGDPSGLPPTLFQVGGDEILLDDAVRMAEKMKAAGCEVDIDIWPRMPHVWHLYARILPEGRRAIADIGAFLERNLQSSN
jgi:monoterpene epsilon-lactone hydrolase